MKINVSLLVAGVAVGLSFPGLAKSNSCPPQEAARVEETIQQVETWPQFVSFYSQHKKCDVDALRYAFTQQVAHLTANDQGLLGLSKMLTKHPQLRSKILGHLKSEAVSSDNRDQILKALQACQPGQKNVCRNVRKVLGSE
jgi:hypothetical protein